MISLAFGLLVEGAAVGLLEVGAAFVSERVVGFGSGFEMGSASPSGLLAADCSLLADTVRLEKGVFQGLSSVGAEE